MSGTDPIERGDMEYGHPAFVLLEDGAVFRGRSASASEPRFGEVVFTTNLSGYQETFTDPSYLGQIVVMTAPMIGNYGINSEDMESSSPSVAGVVVREISRRHSNWRASGSLPDWLSAHDVPLISEVDTRRLTRHIRDLGAMRGVIAVGTEPSEELKEALQASPQMSGLDLASRASVTASHTHGESGPHVVAYDFGIKTNIIKKLVESGFRVTVVPAGTTADEVRALFPDGLFLSNGPGDPAAVEYAIPHIRRISQEGVPTFGICLGHQLLALAYGGSTVKLPYGHRGGNHPVRELASGKILITTQNHGFAVAGDENGIAGAPDLKLTHVNLNDGTVEGLRHRDLPIFAVQYHPEAAPGPHDAFPHFGEFLDSVRAKQG